MIQEQLKPALDAIWQDFLCLSPQTRRIHDLLAACNPQVVTDHIELRTYDLPRVGIAHLARPFEDAGYDACGEYHFPVEQLFARHYEHPDPGLPKLFISEFHVDCLDDDTRNIIHQLVSQIPDATLARDDFAWSGRHWRIDYDTYRQLHALSDHAAWVAAFGFRASHFTVLVNALQSHPSIDEINDFLLQHGFRLDTAGGLVRGTPDEYLEQTSTLADEVEVRFSDRTALIPGGYCEFAKRYPGPDGQLYQGFVAASAGSLSASGQQCPTGY